MILTQDSSMHELNRAAENQIKQAERQLRWDHRYLELAKHVSTWSKDPSTQVGAVLVNTAERLEFVGYNGFPVGVDDNPDRYANRELKYKMVVHAEQNAILKARGFARGGTLYVYPSFAIPNICNDCAKLAIQAGIREVVGYEADPTDPRAARWEESIQVSKMMFIEAGVAWRVIKV